VSDPIEEEILAKEEKALQRWYIRGDAHPVWFAVCQPVLEAKGGPRE